ncbi:MAG: hypothetical protein WCO10_00585 [bacterium]
MKEEKKTFNIDWVEFWFMIIVAAFYGLIFSSLAVHFFHFGTKGFAVSFLVSLVLFYKIQLHLPNDNDEANSPRGGDFCGLD